MQKQRSPSSLATAGIFLLGLPFLLAGLFMSRLYVSGYTKHWAAKSWKETPCWIDSARLETSRNESTAYRAAATYRYQYQGRMYEGHQVSLHGGSDNIGNFQTRTYHELQHYAGNAGSKTRAPSGLKDKKAFRCFVNPTNPEDAVLYRALRSEMQAFLALFALSFPAVGAFLIAGGLTGYREQIREKRLRDQHPDKPWKGTTPWAGEFVPEDGHFRRACLLIYAMWSGAVVLPLVATIALEDSITETKAVVVALIFLGLWGIPSWFSFRHLRQRLAVGRVRFERTDSPSQPGGRLRGSIVFEHPLLDKDGAEVKLECQKRLTQRGGSDGSTTTLESVWSRTERIPVDPGAGGPYQSRIRVDFTLPPDAPESGVGSSSKVQHDWKLTLKIAEPNVHATFQIRVFRTASPTAFDPDNTSQAPSILDTASRDLPALLARRKIHADFDQAGLPVSLVCPPARNRGLVGFLVLFNVVWTGIAVFLISRDAPLVFRIIWPGSAVLLWGILVWNALHKRVATFDASGVTVVNELFPFRWVRSCQKSEILDFSSAAHMTSNTTSFYRIQLNAVLGRKETLVDGITESNTAEALLERLGLWRKSTSVSS
jgi:hypothetical protein